MTTFVTTGGTVYLIDGHLAWPESDPNTRVLGNYNPALDWGPDVAAARGLLVDGSLSRDDYRVRGAGPEWRAVYDYLRQ
jgi:hypothetical protein